MCIRDRVDPVLHAEILERYKKLNLAPYKGFVNPKYEAVKNDKGEICILYTSTIANNLTELIGHTPLMELAGYGRT